MAGLGLLAQGGLQDRSGYRIGQDLQVVSLTSQKGGSGKTTMTGHLAVQAALTGNGPVAIVDTDPQGSIAGWGRVRAAEEPMVYSAAPNQLPALIARLEAEGVKLVFLDTPPAVTEAIDAVVALSDMVLIPTRPSPHDLRAVGATVDIVERHERAMVFIVNSATRGARITAEAAVALSQHGTVAPVTIHHRVDYAASMIDGRTVMEVRADSRSAKEVTGLWEYIADRLDRLRVDARLAAIEVEAVETVETDTKPALGIVSAGAQIRPARGFGRRRPDALQP